MAALARQGKETFNVSVNNRKILLTVDKSKVKQHVHTHARI
jgi:hypothetical protein